MSINNALSNALSGLDAASLRAQVASHNVANASTEGYARQQVAAVQQVAAGRGAGVEALGPERVTDPSVTAARRDAQARASMDGATSQAARRIADAAAAIGDPTSLFARIDALESGLRALSEQPGSSALQARTTAALSDVAGSFRDVASTIQAQRSAADLAIGAAVDEANGALSRIEALGADIAAARSGGRSSAALEQLRDDALDMLAKHVPIRVLDRSGGQIAVLTDGGVTLFDGRARSLEFDPTGFVSAAMDFRAGIGSLSGLSVEGQELTPGSGTQALTGGGIAGLFAVRDGLGPEAATQLDALAADLAGRFEATGLADASGRGLLTDGGAALSATPAPGLAGRLMVNAAVDPAQGGAAWRLRDGLDAAAPGAADDPSRVTALLAAMTERATAPAASAQVGRYSASGLAAALGSTLETAAQSREANTAASAARLSALEGEEAAVQGVDLDREMQDLIRIEQAYAANARVIEVADRMVQRLLEI